MCFPSHSKLKLRKLSLAHRYVLRDGTHKGRSHLHEADNKAGAGKQRPLQLGNVSPENTLITESQSLGHVNAA